uniref:SHSP domain-containing protein n=1 Tax=Parastrongyloides trichosuri TaxID=131310 RepID=A0A0N4ZIK9_PARTI
MEKEVEGNVNLIITPCVFGSSVDKITNTSTNFAIKLDITHFDENEISVNIINDSVVIEGSHEEKTDNYGTIQRHFIRKYPLPNDTDKMSLKTIFKDGILSIEAKKKVQNEDK